MNTAKMELVIFSVRAQLAKTNISSIDVAGDVVESIYGSKISRSLSQ